MSYTPYTVRPAVKEDEPFLWEMLYYAAHMDEEGETSLHAAKEHVGLVKYVRDWGRATDIGCIAVDTDSNLPVGAVWLRLLAGDEKTASYVDDDTPELAIAVAPNHLGRGVGTLLLRHVLAAAREQYSAVVLSVRATNPAQHLYERLGFVVFGETLNRVGTVSFNMRLLLRTPAPTE